MKYKRVGGLDELLCNKNCMKMTGSASVCWDRRLAASHFAE